MNKFLLYLIKMGGNRNKKSIDLGVETDGEEEKKGWWKEAI